MGLKVLLNPFTGTLTMAPTPEVKSIPYELYVDNDAEFIPAIKDNEYNQVIYKFSQGSQHTIRGRFKVPNDYNVGLIRLSFICYTPSVVNGYQFDLRTFLYLPDVGAVGTETLYNDYDSGLQSNPALANRLQKLYINITDNSSQIGGTTVLAGSLIDFRLQRRTLVSGDDVNDIRVIPNLEIIKA